MRARVLLLGLFAAPLLALGACQLFVSFDDPGSPAGDAGPDVHSDAGQTSDGGQASDGGDPCTHSAPPSQPTAATDGGLDESTFLTFAMKTVHFLPPGGWDLDGLCTGDTRSPTSAAPCTPVDGGVVLADLDGGVDDSFGVLATGLKYGNDDPVGAAANIRIVNGNTLFLALTGYSGGKDDDHVQLAVTITHNVQTAFFSSDGGSGVVDGSATGNGVVYAQWDGQDHWGVPGTVVTVPARNGEVVPLELLDGYVADYVLVVHLSGSLWVPLGVDSELHDPIITATIDLKGALPVLRNGIITGRVTAFDLVQSAGHIDLFTAPGVSAPLCAPANQGVYATLRDGLCAAPDIPLQKARDHDGGGTCDGISIALGFEAFTAHLGTHGLDQQPEVCDSGSLLSCNPAQ